MTSFRLDATLEADSIPVGVLDLCEARLMNDRRFPWMVLIPRRAGLTELFELPRTERALLMEEIAAAADALQRLTSADKMNIAALGNQVRQLHIHVIARFAGDDAWPWPIWGKGAPQLYETDKAHAVAGEIARALHLAPNANAL